MTPPKVRANDGPVAWRQAVGWAASVFAAAIVAVALVGETPWLLPVVLLVCSAAVLGMWWLQRSWRTAIDRAVDEWSAADPRGSPGAAARTREGR